MPRAQNDNQFLRLWHNRQPGISGYNIHTYKIIPYWHRYEVWKTSTRWLHKEEIHEEVVSRSCSAYYANSGFAHNKAQLIEEKNEI